MPMGQRKAAKLKATQKQQQIPVQGVPHPMLQLPPMDAAAAAAPVPEVSLSTLQQLEDKKKRLSHQLKDVEKQVGAEECVSASSIALRHLQPRCWQSVLTRKNV